MTDAKAIMVYMDALRSCGMTQIEAAMILEIALEYGQPNHGKWNNNT